MLLESRIDDKTTLFIDAETAGGFAKDDAANAFHPDDALEHVVNLSAGIARRVARAAAQTAQGDPRPSVVEMEFAIKVQGDAVVCLGKTPADGQFTVRVKWIP